MPRLPNPHQAVVDIDKLHDYCLSPLHEDGKHKARVFSSALGLRQWDASWLREQLLKADHVFCEAQQTLMDIPILTPVALLTDLPEQGLTRGQIGTVVELLRRDAEEAVLVEFSDSSGETYATAILAPAQLISLHRRDAA